MSEKEAAAWRAGVDAAADHLKSVAEGLRRRAESTLRDWTGPSFSRDDHQANVEDAREDRRRATVYDEAAASLRRMPAPPAPTAPEPAPAS